MCQELGLTFEFHHVIEAPHAAAKFPELVHGHGLFLRLPGNSEGERIRLRWVGVDLHPLRLGVIEGTDLSLVLDHVGWLLALRLMARYWYTKWIIWRWFSIGIRHLSLEDIITLNAWWIQRE